MALSNESHDIDNNTQFYNHASKLHLCEGDMSALRVDIC